MDHETFKNELNEAEQLHYLKCVLQTPHSEQEGEFTWKLERCIIKAQPIKYSEITKKYYTDKIECCLKNKGFETYFPISLTHSQEKELLKIANKTIHLYKQDCSEFLLKALEKKDVNSPHLSGRGSNRLWQHIEYTQEHGGGVPVIYEVEHDVDGIKARINSLPLRISEECYMALSDKINEFFKKEWRGENV